MFTPLTIGCVRYYGQFESNSDNFLFDEIHLLLYQIKKQVDVVGEKVVEFARKFHLDLRLRVARI